MHYVWSYTMMTLKKISLYHGQNNAHRYLVCPSAVWQLPVHSSLLPCLCHMLQQMYPRASCDSHILLNASRLHYGMFQVPSAAAQCPYAWNWQVAMSLTYFQLESATVRSSPGLGSTCDNVPRNRICLLLAMFMASTKCQNCILITMSSTSSYSPLTKKKEKLLTI